MTSTETHSSGENQLSSSFRASAAAVTNLYKLANEISINISNINLLTSTFRSAAASVTQLYKDANEMANSSYNDGYQACLSDFITCFRIHPDEISLASLQLESENGSGNIQGQAPETNLNFNASLRSFPESNMFGNNCLPPRSMLAVFLLQAAAKTGLSTLQLQYFVQEKLTASGTSERPKSNGFLDPGIKSQAYNSDARGKSNSPQKPQPKIDSGNSTGSPPLTEDIRMNREPETQLDTRNKLYYVDCNVLQDDIRPEGNFTDSGKCSDSFSHHSPSINEKTVSGSKNGFGHLTMSGRSNPTESTANSQTSSPCNTTPCIKLENSASYNHFNQGSQVSTDNYVAHDIENGNISAQSIGVKRQASEIDDFIYYNAFGQNQHQNQHQQISQPNDQRQHYNQENRFSLNMKVSTLKDQQEHFINRTGYMMLASHPPNKRQNRSEDMDIND